MIPGRRLQALQPPRLSRTLCTFCTPSRPLNACYLHEDNTRPPHPIHTHRPSTPYPIPTPTPLYRSLNVCYLYDVFEDDTCVDLVMELCSGGQLWDK